MTLYSVRQHSSMRRPVGVPVKWLQWGWCPLLLSFVVMATGCRVGAGQPGPRGPAVTGRVGPKSLTVALPIDPISLAGGITGNGGAVVPSRYFKEFPNAYLTTYNQQDEPMPWLAGPSVA